MATYVLSSHDGYGLGHVRRNVLIAAELRRAEPSARIVIVTGVERALPWRCEAEVVRVPSLVKDRDGAYANPAMGRQEALERRAERFDATIASVQPDVVVVDRHPSGIDGELRAGLDRARRMGAGTVLGLRDILDEAPVVWSELAGPGWAGTHFDEVVVYGSRHICDHEAEYGLPFRPTYTGWVTDAPPPVEHREPRLLVIASGGGGDGQDVTAVGIELVRRNTAWRGVVINGPHAKQLSAAERIDVVRTPDGCRPLFARAEATVQMAGYNTTIEALAAGIRPILVPRRSPRREQAIRAARFSALGLADMVDRDADVHEISWLLSRPRRLQAGDLDAAGITLDGAARTAQLVRSMVGRLAA